MRFILALLITGGYVAVVSTVVISVVFKAIEVDTGLEMIEEVSKVMAGFIGLIIGYYFSRGQSEDSGASATEANTATQDTQTREG